MGIDTLLRQAEHAALSRISLAGRVVDLGGTERAPYLAKLRGTFSVTSVNMDTGAAPDVMHDLEKPLPFKDQEFDHALLMNVMEHIFDHRQLLAEAARVVRPGGKVIVVVPYLFPYHASPHDYWRFSKEALERICVDAGLTTTSITALGSGVFAARFVMIDRLLPSPLRAILVIGRPFIVLGDFLFTKIARLLGKKYNPSDYALGFCVETKR